MALTQKDLDHVVAVEQKVKDLLEDVKNSLSIQAVGGNHVFNELNNLLPMLKELKDAVEADVAEHATPGSEE